MSSPYVSALTAIAERVGKLGDHKTGNQLLAQVNRLRNGATALDNVNTKRSPLDTPAAHALKVAKHARTYDKEITSALNHCIGAHQAFLDDINRRIADKVNFKIGDEDAREVRAVFRAMKHADRMKALDKLVKEGRGPELHAVVSGTELTTGIHENMRTAFRESFIAKHAAPELEERERINEAWESFMAAEKAAGRYVQELTDPGKLSAIERADADAREAGDSFTQALAPQ
jgi:hypothetical protein